MGKHVYVWTTGETGMGECSYLLHNSHVDPQPRWIVILYVFASNVNSTLVRIVKAQEKSGEGRFP